MSMVGRGGFEPPKAYASRFTVCPLWPLGYLPERAGMAMRDLSSKENVLKLALAGGFEPPTHCLQGSCSAPELRQPIAKLHSRVEIWPSQEIFAEKRDLC